MYDVGRCRGSGACGGKAEKAYVSGQNASKHCIFYANMQCRMVGEKLVFFSFPDTMQHAQ